MQSQFLDIKKLSPRGCVYEPANRFISQLGIAIYTPVRNYDLVRFKSIDKFLSIFLGPAESTLPLPKVRYIEAGIMGRYTYEKQSIYAYPVRYEGFGLQLRQVDSGYEVVRVANKSVAKDQNISVGDILTRIWQKGSKDWLEIANIDKATLRDLITFNPTLKLRMHTERGEEQRRLAWSQVRF